MLSVAEIMTREPYTLGPTATLAEACRLMNAHHIRHLPVVSTERTLIGIVSHRDVLAASAPSLALYRETENSPPLSAIMSSPVQSIDEHASLRGAAQRLQQHRIGCLPVTRGGAVVGIITDSDFVTIAIHLLEQFERVEPAGR